VLPPASLTKIMTVYIAFRELSNNRLNLDDMVTISEKAWRTPGSKMFIPPRSGAFVRVSQKQSNSILLLRYALF
jgi:D-alanyl-D-alanine carboxypeptidase